MSISARDIEALTFDNFEQLPANVILSILESLGDDELRGICSSKNVGSKRLYKICMSDGNLRQRIEQLERVTITYNYMPGVKETVTGYPLKKYLKNK